jgi:hypothetical protein
MHRFFQLKNNFLSAVSIDFTGIPAVQYFIFKFFLAVKVQDYYFAPGEMAERSNAAVLKTVDCQRSGGSNPSLSATINTKSKA